MELVFTMLLFPQSSFVPLILGTFAMCCLTGCQQNSQRDAKQPSNSKADSSQGQQTKQAQSATAKGNAISSGSHDTIEAALAALDSESLIQLLKADPSLLEVNYYEAGTLLHEAAYRHLEPVIRYMVSEGVDVNVTGRLNDSPLHQAIEGQNWDAIGLLLKLGADINWGNGSNPTPLFTAIISQDVESAEKLIAKGADVNATYVNERGQERRPLDFAVLGINR